jgi:hypothetical protein
MIEQRGIVLFCGQKIWKQRISTKKCCPFHETIGICEKQNNRDYVASIKSAVYFLAA